MTITRKLVLLGLALGLTAACGGRAHIADTHGLATESHLNSQREAQPGERLGQMSALDALIALDNHRATFASGGAKREGRQGIQLSARAGGGGGGQLTPTTADFGASDGDGSP